MLPTLHHLNISKMDILLFIIELAALLVATLIPISLLFKTSLSKTQRTCGRTKAPEPPGAWPIIGHLHLLGGQTPVARTLGAMADKYGPIFSLRLGSHHGLVVSNWEAIKECFTTNDRVFASRPSMAVGKYMGYENATFALAPYGPYWRDVRKMVTVELLTARRLDSLSHVRASEVDRFIKDLYSMSSKSCGGNEVVEMGSWFENLTFNITVRMLAGKRFSFWNGDEKDKQFKEAIKKALYLSGVFVFSDAIPSLEWLDIGGYIKAMKQTAKDIDRVLEDWVQERIQTRKKDQTDHFMDVMLSAMHQNEIISGYNRETVIKATILNLILAGTDTTSVHLTWLLSVLLNNPEAMQQAQDEIDTKVGKERWVQESDINNLVYLQAVVKETLRLFPPGPLSVPHEATEDCRVGEFHVPKGTRLLVNVWKLHRDPGTWQEPDRFMPHRFLTTHGDVDITGRHHEFIPFGSGRRSCPGITFATQVTHLTLARLLQAFHFKTASSMPVDMSEGLGVTLPKATPLEVVTSPRLSAALYQN
ncbi:hypothetical protein ACS0TY_015285 [Phlomoides rotata]